MSKGYITNGVTLDGFGARIHRVIQTMALTFYLRDNHNIDLEYIHTPLSYEGFGINFNMNELNRINGGEHPYYEGKREGYLKRGVLWDDKLSYSGQTVVNFNFDNIKVVHEKDKLWTDVKNKKIEDKLYVTGTLHREFNSGKFNINIVDNYYSEIANRFNFINSNIDNSIAIHVRRKDALKETVRTLDDKYYLEILNSLSDDDKNKTTIYTQRQGFSPEKYGDWNIVYDDQEEDFDSFIKMVHAKILFIGKSSFSYAAGLLNQNTVVYPRQLETVGLVRWVSKKNFVNN